MKTHLQDPDFTLYNGDALEVLRHLPDESVHCCLTSPPFYGLRDYGTGRWDGSDPQCDHTGPPKASERSGLKNDGRPIERVGQNDYERAATVPFRDVCGKCGARRVDRQIGLEATPDEWVAKLVEVFREVRRVLRRDGTLWVEVGDSYAAQGSGFQGENGQRSDRRHTQETLARRPSGIKPKDLLGQPFLLAFALRADGWYWRDLIIWHRPNPMPESVRDRTTKAHSYVLMFSKSPRYFWDQEAIAEPAEWARWGDQTVPKYKGTDTATGWMQPKTKAELRRRSQNGDWQSGGLGSGKSTWPDGRQTGGHQDGASKNARSVWTIPTSGYSEAHFATWPPALVERIIRAGTSERGVCPECGAPWVRDIEKETTPTQRVHNGVWDDSSGYGKSGWLPGVQNVKTLGWHPSCDHGHQPTGATVLDPFMGSGTTALVARNLGRKSIGIELNESYCQMAARRLQQLSLLA